MERLDISKLNPEEKRKIQEQVKNMGDKNNAESLLRLQPNDYICYTKEYSGHMKECFGIITKVDNISKQCTVTDSYHTGSNDRIPLSDIICVKIPRARTIEFAKRRDVSPSQLGRMLLDGDVMVDYIGEVCYYRKFINGIGEINPGKYELTEHGKTLFQDCDWSRYVIGCSYMNIVNADVVKKLLEAKVIFIKNKF